jgi:hypothetical protein
MNDRSFVYSMAMRGRMQKWSSIPVADNQTRVNDASHQEFQLARLTRQDDIRRQRHKGRGTAVELQTSWQAASDIRLPKLEFRWNIVDQGSESEGESG